MAWPGGVLDGLARAWNDLPAAPDLDLSPPSDPALMLVIATLLSALGLMGLVTAWVEQRLSRLALGATLLGLALFVWVWNADRDGVGWLSVPEAFVELLARFVR